MQEHGTAAAALEALPGVAAAAGVKGYEIAPLPRVESELDAARRAGATFVAIGSPEYPKLLAEIPDPPPFLWALGNAELLSGRIVALVGARNASSLGTRMARKLAATLGEAGITVVSGLARGIDAATHVASIDTGTIAVVGGGVDVTYPTENADLQRDISERGLVLSEQPMGLQPQARHFPRRNRIISGVAEAVIVVEAAAKSGSLITARTALDQGREVMAVPGHPFDARASGCNILLRDGATLVRGASDVIEALERPEPKVPETLAEPAPPRREGPLQDAILTKLGPSPVAEDQLIRDLGTTAAAIAPELVELELSGRIQRQPGGLLCRAV